MKYFVLLAGNGELPEWDELTEAQQEEMFARLGAFDEACAAHPQVELLGGEALEVGSTTTLRTRNGELVVTDGPFAEVAEHIGGYYVLSAPDVDAVISLCRELPAYDIEIRPIAEMP